MPEILGLREGVERDADEAGALDHSEQGGPTNVATIPRLGKPRLLALLGDFEVSDAGQLVLMTAPRLQREGFEVLVAALGCWGLLGEDLEARGVRAVAVGMRGPFDPRAAGRLLALLRRERIQIVHGHRTAANLAARVLGRLADVPVVIAGHDDTDLAMGLGGRLVETVTAPLSDAVVICSEAGRRYALETFHLGPGLVHTLPGAVDLREEGADQARRDAVRRELGAGPQDLLVGTVGRLREPKKGLSIFFPAARLLARDLPRVRFAVIGAGPDRARLEARAAEEGVSHRTVFAGQRRDIPVVLRALDLFVEPSIWEGFGLTVLEAMAAEAPIVATRVGALEELLTDGQTGLLVPVGDAAAMAAACAALLRDRDRAARLAAAARRRVASAYGIDRLVGEMTALYRVLLARARASSEMGSPAPWRRA